MKMHASCIRLPISVTATLLAMMLVAVATGCRRDPQLAVYLDAVNSEKRMLEDRLYELQHKYDEAQKELERLKKSGAESRPSRRERARTEPRRTVDELPPPKVKLPTDDSGDDLDLRPPTIDPGQPSKPDQSATPRRSTGQTVSRREARTESPSAKPKVARIVIDPDQTEGVDRDGRVGDDGLRLALLPLDDQGKFIHEAAPVTVELYDPRDPAEPLAVWEFNRQETELSLHRADVGRGIRLQMKLPPRRTQSSYQLRVIYDPDGPQPRIVEHRMTLTPDTDPAPARASSRWTPRGAK